jgi:hypothetical protein
MTDTTLPALDFDNADTIRPYIAKALEGYDRTLTGNKAAAAAEITNRLYDALRALAKAEGMNPLYEVHAWHPHHKGRVQGQCYGVSWESGPANWAHTASFLVMDLTGRLCEPYYSFDLCLYEAE